jgi:limonene-1,2-epoxide hydrolase
MPDPETVVREFCAAWSRRNIDELLGYFTDDAVYHNMPLEPAVGRQAIRDTIAGFTGMADKMWFDVLRIMADGPIVMTERVDHIVMGDRDIALPVMGTFEVSDGKITAWRDYFDMNQFTSQMSAE